MQRFRLSTKAAVRSAALALVTAGTVYASACSAIDVRHNVVGGTMSFIKGYTTDLLFEVFPAPSDVAGNAEE